MHSLDSLATFGRSPCRHYVGSPYLLGIEPPMNATLEVRTQISTNVQAKPLLIAANNAAELRDTIKAIVRH